MITKKQKEILEYIKKYQFKHEYSPALEDIKKHFRMSSVSTAHHHIKKLEEKGFLRKDENKPRSISVFDNEKMVNIQLMGRIAAGRPIEAITEKETIAIPQSKISNSGSYYALKVVGDSMIDENINDGDIVLVKQQETAENGQKIVALIDNHEATLKKFYKEKGHIRLQPASKSMEPLIFRNGRDVSIQGIVLDVIRNEGAVAIQIPEYKISEEYKKLPLNKIICGDAVEIMKAIPSNSIDIVITSPPYDAVRDYKGFTLDLHAAGREIYRILKNGGVAVMVIQDQTKNFGKSLTSFRTIVDWVDNIGFKLFETVIYRKYGAEGAWWNKRFRVDHEYMPIFLKGERPQYFNKEPLKIPSKHGGKTMTGGGTRLTNGIRIATRPITINPMKCRGTIWEYMTAGDGTRLKHQHPATFPDKLPIDFIQCFCPEDGIVLDPFVGSGTTVLAAVKSGRNYLGIDISDEYCKLTEKRLKEETNNQDTLF